MCRGTGTHSEIFDGKIFFDLLVNFSIQLIVMWTQLHGLVAVDVVTFGMSSSRAINDPAESGLRYDWALQAISFDHFQLNAKFREV